MLAEPQVHDVNSLAEMQYRGSVLLKKHGGDAAKGSAAKRAALHKMHECLSPPIIAKMERLRKRCGGKLMVGTNRYYFYVPDLMEILLEQHLFRVTLEMAGEAASKTFTVQREILGRILGTGSLRISMQPPLPCC